MAKIILVLLKIYCSLQQCKNFANPPSIDKVIAMVRVAPFFDSRCSRISTTVCYSFAVIPAALCIGSVSYSFNKNDSSIKPDHAAFGDYSSSMIQRNFRSDKAVSLCEIAKFPHTRALVIFDALDERFLKRYLFRIQFLLITS